MEPVRTKPLALVVEDDRDTRELYRLVLDIHGYGAAEAADITEAVRVSELLHPDIVITDWLLPDGNGLRLAARLRSISAARRTPIIAITGLVMSSAERQGATDGGFSRVLLKPVLPDTIIETVQQVMLARQSRQLRATALRILRQAHRVRKSARNAIPDSTNLSDRAGQMIGRALTRTSARIAVLIADNDAHYVAASETAASITGYAEPDLLKLSVWDLTPAPDEAQGRVLWNTFIASRTQEGRYVLRRRDGVSIEAQYYAIANVAPGLHVSALAVLSPTAAVLPTH